MKWHPVNFKVKKNRDHSQFVPQYKPLFWMTQEKVDLEFFYHRKYLFSLTNEKTMKACYLNCWTTSESLRKPIKTRSNEWFACNRIIDLKKMILESFCLTNKICWKIYRCAAQSFIWNWHHVMVSKQRNIS